MLVQSSFLLLGAVRIYRAQVESWAKETQRVLLQWQKEVLGPVPCTKPTEAETQHLLQSCASWASITLPLHDATELVYEPQPRQWKCTRASIDLPASVETIPDLPHTPAPVQEKPLFLETPPLAPLDLDLSWEGPSADALRGSVPSTVPAPRLSIHTETFTPAPLDAQYKFACQRPPKRQRTCPVDAKTTNTPEEWAQRSGFPACSACWYNGSSPSIPRDAVAWFSTCRSHAAFLSSPHLTSLWQSTLGQRIHLLQRHFQQCTIRSKNAWAAAQRSSVPPPLPLDPPTEHEAPSFALLSPEVGRARDTSDFPDVNDLFPWSHLGEAQVEWGTPRPASEARANESFSSAYGSVVEAAAHTLPSLPRESGAAASPRMPYSPLFTPRTSLAPGVLSRADASLDGFDGTSQRLCSIACPGVAAPNPTGHRRARHA